VDGPASIETAAYSIPEVRLRAMIDEQLIALTGNETPGSGRQYKLTEKALRLAARARSGVPKGE
jgi:hypothetical protein